MNKITSFATMNSSSFNLELLLKLTNTTQISLTSHLLFGLTVEAAGILPDMSW